MCKSYSNKVKRLPVTSIPFIEVARNGQMTTEQIEANSSRSKSEQISFPLSDLRMQYSLININDFYEICR